jgi:hypothetical protein
MQGHWQTVQFQVPLGLTPGAEDELPPDPSLGLSTVPVTYTVISRRSRERAGLRYQRRGSDASGSVANFVETEAVAVITVSRYPFFEFWATILTNLVLSIERKPTKCVQLRSNTRVQLSRFL